jgi:hypothetical protein
MASAIQTRRVAVFGIVGAIRRFQPPAYALFKLSNSLVCRYTCYSRTAVDNDMDDLTSLKGDPKPPMLQDNSLSLSFGKPCMATSRRTQRSLACK